MHQRFARSIKGYFERNSMAKDGHRWIWGLLAAMPVLCSCASRNLVQAQSAAATQSTFTAPRGAIKVELKRTGQGYQLLRDGKPFLHQGRGWRWFQNAFEADGREFVSHLGRR
jgi:hypothetical protein